MCEPGPDNDYDRDDDEFDENDNDNDKTTTTKVSSLSEQAMKPVVLKSPVSRLMIKVSGIEPATAM